MDGTGGYISGLSFGCSRGGGQQVSHALPLASACFTSAPPTQVGFSGALLSVPPISSYQELLQALSSFTP